MAMTKLLTAVWTLALTLLGAMAAAGPLEDGIAALDAGQYQAAHDAFLKAAKAGNTEAQVQLAILLLDGTVGRRDPKAAAGWFEKAAKRGDAYSMYRLGTLIEDGIVGKPDPSRAAPWYEKAVQRGYPNAAYRLAVLYDRGRGVTANPERAMALYRQAAVGGVLKAKHALGAMLAQGRKVTADAVEGMMWLELAWRGGDGDVIDELKTFRTALTPAQQAAMKSRLQAHLRGSPHY